MGDPRNRPDWRRIVEQVIEAMVGDRAVTVVR